MGWSFTHKPAGVTAKEFILKNELEWNSDTHEYTVLKSAIVNLREFYAAIEKRDRTTGDREVFAVIFLIEYRPHDAYNFGMKAMDETVMPYYFNCPAAILDLLTPTDRASSNEWRAACRAKTANVAAIKPGATIEYGGKRYGVQEIRKGGRVMLRGLHDGALYGMSRQRARDAKVVA